MITLFYAALCTLLVLFLAGRVMAYRVKFKVGLGDGGHGELNRRFGMFPTEGYGLSNDPTVSGPPAFEDSAFDVGADPASISIAIRY